MARSYNKRVISIKPTSIAMLQGTFASIIGLWVAIVFSLNNTVDIANSTQSVLAGLTFGVASGAAAIIVIPLVYFGIGWIVGLIQGWIINFVIESAGGVEVEIIDNKKEKK